MDEEQKVKLGIDLVFYRSSELSEDLHRIAAYYEYIGDRIRFDVRRVDCDPVQLGRFEAVYLILQEILREYPVEISNQISEIFRENNLCELFATLAAARLNRDGTIDVPDVGSIWFQALTMAANVINRSIQGGDEVRITKKELFRARTALKRVAGILRYAEGLELGEKNEVFEEAKDGYDPAQINKGKLIVQLGVLRSQLESVPDGEIRGRLLKMLDRVETELKRKKVRWSRVITGLFVLFSFVADVKTLAPGSYEAIYDTVTKIFWTVHTEGLVRTSLGQSVPLLPSSGNRTDDPTLAGDVLIPRRINGVRDFEQVDEE